MKKKKVRKSMVNLKTKIIKVNRTEMRPEMKEVKKIEIREHVV